MDLPLCPSLTLTHLRGLVNGGRPSLVTINENRVVVLFVFLCFFFFKQLVPSLRMMEQRQSAATRLRASTHRRFLFHLEVHPCEMGPGHVSKEREHPLEVAAANDADCVHAHKGANCLFFFFLCQLKITNTRSNTPPRRFMPHLCLSFK